MENIFDFYKGKRVFLTGHTGFKGSWLCKMLANAGAIVIGYSLEAPTEPSLFKIANIENDIKNVIGVASVTLGMGWEKAINGMQ